MSVRTGDRTEGTLGVLNDIANLLRARNPLSLKIITLLDKPERRVVELNTDLSLFTIPDLFLQVHIVPPPALRFSPIASLHASHDILLKADLFAIRMLSLLVLSLENNRGWQPHIVHQAAA